MSFSSVESPRSMVEKRMLANAKWVIFGKVMIGLLRTY